MNPLSSQEALCFMWLVGWLVGWLFGQSVSQSVILYGKSGSSKYWP